MDYQQISFINQKQTAIMKIAGSINPSFSATTTLVDGGGK
jgi:hypothetical protein